MKGKRLVLTIQRTGLLGYENLVRALEQSFGPVEITPLDPKHETAKIEMGNPTDQRKHAIRQVIPSLCFEITQDQDLNT